MTSSRNKTNLPAATSQKGPRAAPVVFLCDGPHRRQINPAVRRCGNCWNEAAPMAHRALSGHSRSSVASRSSGTRANLPRSRSTDGLAM
jgi:hypothetical protein